jgi:hypothetical protein
LEDLQPTLNRFWETATRICDEVLSFRPDAVVALMHAGRVPLSAAIQLWTETRPAPFAPTIYTNLGSEKFARYDCLEDRPGIFKTFVGSYEIDRDIAHFLAWLVKQQAWQMELRAQFQCVLGDAAPERILVVDDFIQNGSTWILALGLLNLVFPQAQVHFLSDQSEFHNPLWRSWAQQFHPELLEMVKAEEADKSIKFKDRIIHRIQHLANGTEDIDPEALTWRPITADSKLPQSLSPYLPAGEWLSLPKFVDSTISAEILRRAASYEPNPIRTGETWLELKPDWLMLSEIWLHGTRTRNQIMDVMGWSKGKTRSRLLRHLERGGLVVERRGGTNLYSHSPDAYPEYGRRERPLLDAYWVTPGQFLAGDFPGWPGEPDLDQVHARVEWLLDSGVTSFMDLSSWYEGRPETYESLLNDKAARRGLRVEYHAFSPKLRRLPKLELVNKILDAIDKAIARRQVVYVHCDNGVEVTGIVVGGYLVRRGRTGPLALQEVERLRAGTFEAWKRSPLTERGRRMVRRWKA